MDVEGDTLVGGTFSSFGGSHSACIVGALAGQFVFDSEVDAVSTMNAHSVLRTHCCDRTLCKHCTLPSASVLQGRW